MASVGGHGLRAVRALSQADVDGGTMARFRDVVEAQPGDLAVEDGELAYTFLELARRAARVRQQVLGQIDPAYRGCDEPIALLYTHTADAVAALFGILASGSPVLVLDPRTPAPRLSALLHRVKARHVFTDAGCQATAAQIGHNVLLDSSGQIDESEHGDALAAMWAGMPAPDATASLAFTSGSTGRPKVVVTDHRMLVQDAWANSVATDCYGADDIVAHTLPMAFFAGLMATCAGVLAGTTMRLYDVRGRGIQGLPGWIESNGVTVVQASPAILRSLISTGPAPGQLATIRSLTIAGETAYGPDIEAARALLPRSCVLRNRYGSTETGLIAEYPITGDHPPIEGALPAGYAIPGTVVSLADESGAPVAEGEPGIITITAPHPARGYFEDPEITAAVFTANEDGTRTYRSNDLGVFGPDGELRMLGRRDHSVKIRGYLVEPGEIDALLFARDDVAEAVTTGLPRADGKGMRLVSYVVSTAERPSAVAIRTALHELLPGYMVPETVLFLDALPRTERGKLDRSALPQPPALISGSSTGTLSEWEQVVQAIWCTVLALPDVGRDDDFFELGGDSLAAEALMSIMVNQLGVPHSDATTSNLVQAPTLSAFASRLKRRPGQANQILVPLRTKGSRPPLFISTGGGGLGVAMVPIMRHLDQDLPVYALQSHGLEARGIPDWTVSAAARRNVTTLRGIQADGPYYLAGHSFGGIVALEMAQQLRKAGQEVAMLIVMDSFPPDSRSHSAEEERSIKQRLKDAVGVATTGVRGTPGDDQFWRFWRQSNVLHRRYRTTTYPGDTLVLVADTPERDQRIGWGPYLSGRWRMANIAGDHVSMLRDPYAKGVAELIWEAVRDAQDEQARQSDQLSAVPDGQPQLI